MDRSNGYESYAREYAKLREQSEIGVVIARNWAASLERGAEVLEIGCGSGLPVSGTLVAAGLKLWVVDASSTLLQEFRSNFSHVPARCEPVETSDYFGRTFDAVVAIGLLFLLSESTQYEVIRRVAGALRAGGRFLFSAPLEAGSWRDQVTGFKSLSLGRDRYEDALSACGLRIVGTYQDEGANNHYDVLKPDVAAVDLS